MWVKKDGDQQIMFYTHVDDSFVTASSETTLRNFRNRMISPYGGRFDDTADMDAKEYVGMEWERDVEGNTSKLHQVAFCEKTVEGFRILALRKASKDAGNSRRQIKHRGLTGSDRSDTTSSI